eukprot:gene6476-6976_t
MSGKLSERFQELKTSGGNTNRIRNNNRQQRAVNQQQQRGNKINQRRGIVTANSTSTTGTKVTRRTNQTTKVTSNGKVRINKARPNSADSQSAQNRRGAGRGNSKGPNNKKKGPVTGQDLDKELDSYWFAAGKGPNPDVASLDREMDDYFKSKPAGEQLENEAST